MTADTKDTVLVVGHQGQTSWFYVIASAASFRAVLRQHERVSDTLRVALASSRKDTVELDTIGIESVTLGGAEVSRADGAYPLVVTPTTNEMVHAVGRNGSVDSFRVIGSAKPLSRDSLVKGPSSASWIGDVLMFEHAGNASDTVSISAKGVESVVVGESSLAPVDGRYRVVVTGVQKLKVVVTGRAGQEMTFHVVATAAARIDNKPGLGATLLSPMKSVVGAICSLRVRIDSGEVSSVVLLKGKGIQFKPGTDSVWSLDWPTAGTTDSLRIDVCGTGRDGKADTVHIVKEISYDRAGPGIALPAKTLVVGPKGGSIAWNVSDESGVESIWFDGLSGQPCTDASDAGAKECRADGVDKTFTIHSRDAFGNVSQETVTVLVDAVAPRIESVAILGGRLLNPSGDTIKVDSGAQAAIRWKASDSLRSFHTFVKMEGTVVSMSEAWAKSGGWDTASGLGKGLWTLAARDSFGNEAEWGTFLVFEKPAEVKIPVDTTKELAMELVALPDWVGKAVEVTLKRTAGRVDSIAWNGPKFATTGDSVYWMATWTPDASASTDTLAIKVYGHTATAPNIIDLRQGVSIDRVGPKLDSVVGARGKLETASITRIDNKGNVGLRIHSSESRFVARLWNGAELISAVETDVGVATIGMTPMEHTNSRVRLELFDSLGNLGDTGVYMVHPFVSAPVFSESSGVYGSDRITMTDDGERFVVGAICPDQGMVLDHADDAAGSTNETYEVGKLTYTGSVSSGYVCVDPNSPEIRSDVVQRDFILPLRPDFLTEKRAFSGTLNVRVGMNGGNDTIPNAVIEYCLADPATCSQDDVIWSTATKSDSGHLFTISVGTPVGIRVAIGKVHGHAAYADFTMRTLTPPRWTYLSMNYGYEVADTLDGYRVRISQCQDYGAYAIWSDSGKGNWEALTIFDFTLRKPVKKSFKCVLDGDSSDTWNYHFIWMMKPKVTPPSGSFTDSVEVIATPSDSSTSPENTYFDYCFSDVPPKSDFEPCGRQYTYTRLRETASPATSS